MLKLLLGHWQSHREPLPFVLTDDPLYCSHLTKSPFPEVYSVNRINPIFEEDEGKPKVTTNKTLPIKRKELVVSSPNFVLRKPVNKANSNVLEYASRNHDGSLKRANSEEETKSSDDTGYSSSGPFKSLHDSEGDDRPMSSDSDDYSRPEPVVTVVSAEVHRVSTPDDVLVRSPSSESSANYSYRSYGSSPEPFDSLTMSSSSSAKDRRSNSAVRQKLQRLLEKGNEGRKLVRDPKDEIQKTKNDLMMSLTRALNNKVPKRDDAVVTRSDDTKSTDTARPPSTSSSTTPKAVLVSSESDGVTRQDESNSSSLSSFPKTKQRSDKEPKVDPPSTKGHRCKVCENAHRPLAFHQLLPGHWSYDNVYLPQIHGMMCPCMHHHPLPSSEDDVFFPSFPSRSRHSWALHSDGRKVSKDKETKDARYSPDGETDCSNTSSNHLRKSFSGRRSLRETKGCGCDHCLDCSCHCLSHHRKVKFASDSDLSQHKHLRSFRAKNGMVGGGAALVMSMPHLNGHVTGKGGSKESGKPKKPLPPFVPRGLKEPIKMEELYGAYPMTFRDWESHYRRNFLQKRKKRALTMVGMAIGIVMVVGIAVALTFVFLRIKRPAS